MHERRITPKILIPAFIIALAVAPFFAIAANDGSGNIANSLSQSGASGTSITSTGSESHSQTSSGLYAPSIPNAWEKVTTPIINPVVPKMRVAAEPRGGTYFDQVIVVLYTSNPKAKIWYVTDPNASPGDAMPYTGAIVLKKSTPILFFAYVNEQIESKIMREDYIIKPTPDDVLLHTGAVVALNTPDESTPPPVKHPTTKKPSSSSTYAYGATTKPSKSSPMHSGSSDGSGSSQDTALAMNSGDLPPSSNTEKIASSAPSQTQPNNTLSSTLKASSDESKGGLGNTAPIMVGILIFGLGAGVLTRAIVSRKNKKA